MHWGWRINVLAGKYQGRASFPGTWASGIIAFMLLEGLVCEEQNRLVGIICPSIVADAGSACLQCHAVPSTHHLLHSLVNPPAIPLGMKGEGHQEVKNKQINKTKTTACLGQKLCGRLSSASPRVRQSLRSHSYWRLCVPPLGALTVGVLKLRAAGIGK